ncbi:hypothetical protein SAMN04488082_11588 [Desulfomicrobium apsheronum]|uniref:Amidophosphoribosyltransferase n=1 Tax=Desulfomicrobium apsheronum TaxID=52560 RepID=A0A1I3X8D2_9BACT|nr:amidophosphoribosyltransferase [Desulfomicrobium apsheronum]SFK15597.1 hypothetical protein SAMN04488082_11588 [Desulfomicrobium apsheronum]
MNEFVIESNYFLSRKINAFFHTDYVGYKKPGNPNYINILKNTYNSYSASYLNSAVNDLLNVLHTDLPLIVKKINSEPIYVCVVPRAKSTYQPNQLLFKKTVSYVSSNINGLIDETNGIVRHTNTKTTHLPPNTPNYENDGDYPYKGITKNTCHISDSIRNKSILLVDDIYTQTINIIEDAIEALLEQGAKSVIFYSVAKTVR